jgi:hypothetical protein
MVINKSDEDALILSFDNVDDSWVFDSRVSFMLNPIEVIFLIISKGILGWFIWEIMNPFRLLERKE